MTPEQWRRLDDLFEAACALPPAQWHEFARSSCADDPLVLTELESMLAAHAADGDILARPVARVDQLVDASLNSPDSMIGSKVGQFTIERVLGRGGMGVVYLAHQESPKRPVALKVIHPGLLGGAAVRRFSREAEALGKLQHPGVAQIFESGRAKTSQGVQPYFAMELVDGKPLLEHAKDRSLSVRDRLELMAKICDAVQFAHVKGIIHRDLKPGNILVDSMGQPKILDFGIARIAGPEGDSPTIQTGLGQLIGTMPYMSPEQVSGDSREVDTRSDVYALGVVLFELLAGRLPLDVKDRPVPEAVRMVSEQEPTRLATLSRQFRGDIDTIAQKALEKDRTRRYQSALDLGADIRRFLADQAIIARPASTVYQLRKFARRNKVLVTGVIAAMVLLIAGIIGTSVGLARALRAEKQAVADAKRASDAEKRASEDARLARIEAANAKEVTAFLQNMLQNANPESGKVGDVTVRELLAQASSDLEANLKNQPEVRASIHLTIGTAYEALDDEARAREHLERALELRRIAYGDRGWRVSNCLHRLAFLDLRAGRTDDALAGLRRALDMITVDPDGSWEDVSIQHSDFASALLKAAKYSEAESEATTAIELARTRGGDRHPLFAEATSRLSDVLIAQGKYSAAEQLCRVTIDIDRERFGPRSPRVAIRLIELGRVLSSLSRDAEAEPVLLEAIEIRRATFGPRHPKVALALERVANAQMSLKQFVKAESSARESLAIRREALGDDHEDTVSGMVILSRVLARQNKLDEAEPLAQEALQARIRVLGETHRLTAQTMETLGDLFIRRKKYDEAKEVLLRAVDVRKRSLSPRHVLVSNGLRDLGRACAEQRDFESAVRYFTEAESILAESLPEDHNVLTGVRRSLGLHCKSLGRLEQSEGWYRKALAGLIKKSGERGEEVSACLTAIAEVLSAQGRDTESIEMQDRAKKAAAAGEPPAPAARPADAPS